MANYRGFWTLLRREIYRFLSLPNQTLLPAIINAALFVIVFGSFLGNRVREIEGFPYIVYIFPGLLMMGVVSSAFSSASTSLFISRWDHFVQDLLLAPLSHFQIVLAYVLACMIRAMLIGVLILGVGLLFIPTPFVHPLLFIVAILSTAAVFASFGLILGLWADRWDNLAVFQNYIITPLMFLGGVFYSTNTLPEQWRWVNQINPIYYMVSGVRYSFLGTADEAFGLSLLVSLVFAAIFFLWVLQLFRIGYKIRT